jgi:beta-glucanase (GH16 family)
MPLPISRPTSPRSTSSPHRPRRRTAAAATALALGVPALVGGLSSPGVAATSTSTGSTSISGWKLDLNDGFDSLSTSRWTVKNNATSSNEESYLLARNVTTSGGILKIQSKKESMGGRKYTSGYVHGRGKYSLPNYFRVEMRAQVPLERGMWAAPMWFRPADGGAGEIDLVETYGHDMEKFGEYRVHHTVHNAYGSGHQTNQKQQVFPGDPRGWHTYVIEKTPGKIEMFVDGQRKGLWQQGDPSWFNSIFESGKRWSMIMNLQIGGHRGSPDSSTAWGEKTALKIDYVRTWTR